MSAAQDPVDTLMSTIINGRLFVDIVDFQNWLRRYGYNDLADVLSRGQVGERVWPKP